VNYFAADKKLVGDNLSRSAQADGGNAKDAEKVTPKRYIVSANDG
jgi:hypothetical protein